MNLSDKPLTDREKHQLIAGFNEAAVQRSGSHGNIVPFSFTLKEGGKLVGAIAGQTFWGALKITDHWVDHSLRHQGHGDRLLKAAEHFAIESGCEFMTVETFDEEAHTFYLHHGFELELERGGYAGGALHLFLLKKRL